MKGENGLSAWRIWQRLFLIELVYVALIEVLYAAGVRMRYEWGIVPLGVLLIVVTYRSLRPYGIVHSLADFLRQTFRPEKIGFGLMKAAALFGLFYAVGRLFGAASLTSGAYIPPAFMGQAMLLFAPFMLLVSWPILWIWRLEEGESGGAAQRPFLLAVACTAALLCLIRASVPGLLGMFEAEWVSLLLPAFAACIVARGGRSIWPPALFLTLLFGGYLCLQMVPYKFVTCLSETVLLVLFFFLLDGRSGARGGAALAIVCLLLIVNLATSHNDARDARRYFKKHAEQLMAQNHHFEAREMTPQSYDGFELLLFHPELYSMRVNTVAFHGEKGLTVWFKGDVSLMLRPGEVLTIDGVDVDTVGADVGAQWEDKPIRGTPEDSPHGGMRERYTKLGEGWFIGDWVPAN